MTAAPEFEELLLAGPVGQLEVLLEWPSKGSPIGVAAICHPHPVHGGTMRNKVTHTLARAFVNRQFAALRFNFRGVGVSAGSFDNGRGELADAIAAIHWLTDRYSGVPLWLAGFSFGAAIAIAAAADRDADGLVSVAPAMSRIGSNTGPMPTCPWLVIQGDNDELVDVDETIAWLNGLEAGPELQVFSGTEHFFHGKLVPLRVAVETFIAAHVEIV